MAGSVLTDRSGIRRLRRTLTTETRLPGLLPYLVPVGILALVLGLTLLAPELSLRDAQPGSPASPSEDYSEPPALRAPAVILTEESIAFERQDREDVEAESVVEAPSESDDPSSLALSVGAAPVEPPPVEPIFHRVRRDETLSEIAEIYGLDWLTLAKYNGLANPNRLELGQELEIPPTDRAVAAARSDQRPPLRGPLTVLDAVYRSQSDGSVYADSNCGPAALGMFLTAFGEYYSTEDLRRSVNEHMGVWSPDAGSTWQALAHAAQVRGYQPVGLYAAGGGGYHSWTIDELMAEVEEGRPVMLLVHFRSLPGQEHQTWWGDHYILFLGLDENDDVVYHDPAFPEQGGSFLVASQERIINAWTNTASGRQRTAMALRPAESESGGD